MEMTYESFVETLRSELLEATGYDEEMISTYIGGSASIEETAE